MRPFACLVFASCLSACYLAEPRVDDGGLVGPVTPVGGEGVPCEVQAVLARRCLSCHGEAPRVGPVALGARADFAASTASGRGVAEVTLARLRDGARPMPPSGVLPEAELAIVEAWLRAGFPVGPACEPRDAGAPTGADVDAGPGGLPCDVEALVATNCRACHQASPSGGAPMPLVSRAHFLAPALSNPAESNGARSIARMQSASAPMPPSGALPAAQVAVLSQWVAAGMPEGACAPADAGPDPFAEPPRCTSGATWSQGNFGSSLMNPGAACLSCHRTVNQDEGKEEAPEALAGTVYPSAHEPTLCNGLGGGAVVIIRGADGVEFRLTANSVGNFFLRLSASTNLVRPYTARVEYQGRVRRMATPQTSGDCNACHTQAGTNGAPGRVLAP